MKLGLCDIGIDNQYFWWYFFRTNFPNAYIENEDLELDEILAPYEPAGELEWVNTFTQFYDGVMDETDGYLENPTTLITEIWLNKTLKVEFHPGDTVYYMNDVEIGCTGPHWKLQVLPYSTAESVLSNKDGIIYFFLLLPLITVKADEVCSAQARIEEILLSLFPENICEQLANCILSGLTENELL